MKKTSWGTALVASFLLLSLTACGNLFGNKSNGNNTTNDNNNNNDNEITENITTSVTWDGKDSSGNPLTYYINKDLYIKDGGHLTITDGAIVKFGPNGRFVVNTTGAITANGAKFTSYRDPVGRTISAAPDSNPAMGDWKQIDIKGGTGKFTSCKFYYGGKGELSTVAVSDSTGKARVDQCEFRYCDGTHATRYDVKAALRYTDGVTYNAETNCVTNTVFKNNKWPLAMPVYFTLDGSNRFGTTAEDKNEYNYININSIYVKINATWAKQDVPYLFANQNNEININQGGNLTIQGSEDEDDLTVVCFADEGMLIKQGGVLQVPGYVTFRNSPESESTPFKGIICYVGGNKKMLTTSTDGKVQILHCENNSFGSDKQTPIQATNTGN